MRKLAVCLAALTLAGCSTLSPRRDADEARVRSLLDAQEERR